MTAQAKTYGESLELDFKGKTIRALMVDRVPWFALVDAMDALGWDHETLAAVDRPDFPAFAKMTAGEEADEGSPDAPGGLVLVSPVGLYFWASFVSPGPAQRLSAWSKKEVRRLCPEPVPGDRNVFLTIVEDEDGRKDLPPYPMPWGGYRSEWMDLRDSPQWQFRNHPELLIPSKPRPVIDQVERAALQKQLLAEAAEAIEKAHAVRRARELGQPLPELPVVRRRKLN